MGCGTLVGVIVLGLIIIAAFSGIFSSSTKTTTPSYVVQTGKADVAAHAQLVAECKQKADANRLAYDKLLAAGKPWEATNALRACAIALNDPDLKRLIGQAEIQDYWATMSNAKQSAALRAGALLNLERDYPQEATAHEKRFSALRTQIERAVKEQDRKEAAAEAARRRREGVRLGMTPEEVRASSWGRPEHINTSIGSWGRHEQWVYGGHNYLYFENGKLTSIQN